MSGIYGPSGSGSSPSASLQSSLESKLRAGLDGSGSPLFVLTWKRWDMLSGPPICALRASAHRISDKDSGGWPTPTALNRVRNEATLAKCAAFRKRNASQNTVPLYLGEVARLAFWGTPRANKWGFPDAHGSQEAPLASWATPGAKDGDKSVRSPKGAAKEAERKGWQNDLCTNAMATLGPTSNGSPASTASSGQLNPDFSLWLMGFPPEWLSFAPSETRSFRKSRRGSSSPREPASIALSEIIGDEER